VAGEGADTCIIYNYTVNLAFFGGGVTVRIYPGQSQNAPDLNTACGPGRCSLTRSRVAHFLQPPHIFALRFFDLYNGLIWGWRNTGLEREMGTDAATV